MFALGRRTIAAKSNLFLAQTIRLESTAAYTNAIKLLKTDLKQAMLAKDDIKKTTIRTLMSSIKNKEIDTKNKDFDEFMLVELYSRMITQRKDSIQEFLKNKREDLVGREETEISIIKNYLEALPVASREQVEANVVELLKKLQGEQADLLMKDVFKKIDLKTLPNEWNTSSTIIRSVVAQQFKNVFK